MSNQYFCGSFIFQLSSYDFDSAVVEQRQQFRIEVVVLNQNLSTGSTAYNVILVTMRDAFKIDYQNNFIPDTTSEGLDLTYTAIELRQDVLESKLFFSFPKR